MSEDLRNRFKSKQPKKVNQSKSDPDSLFKVWSEQKRIAKEDKVLQDKYKKAKQETKQLRKKVIKNNIGTELDSVKNWISKLIVRVKKIWSQYGTVRSVRIAAGLVAVLVVVVMINATRSNNVITGTLGDSVTDDNPALEDLPREKSEFKLIFPTGKSADDYDVVRISPPESAPSYTYLDRFTDDGQIFRVTQQELPENFDLAKTATDFQATSIIQIDDNVAYHGYSEKGGVQSILFIKDNKFIAIRSPQKFSDDLWANYFLSLK